MPAVRTCQHQFPFMQQISVRNEILQRDGLYEMFQILKDNIFNCKQRF